MWWLLSPSRPHFSFVTRSRGILRLGRLPSFWWAFKRFTLVIQNELPHQHRLVWKSIIRHRLPQVLTRDNKPEKNRQPWNIFCASQDKFATNFGERSPDTKTSRMEILCGPLKMCHHVKQACTSHSILSANSVKTANAPVNISTQDTMLLGDET